jgi:hypothetical protein
MQDQPKAIAYRENSFYKDGTGSRPLVEGTVPRGYLREDRTFYLERSWRRQATGSKEQTPRGQATARHRPLYPDDVETFPIPID